MRMMVMIIYLLFLICMIVYYGKMMYRNYQKELPLGYGQNKIVYFMILLCIIIRIKLSIVKYHFYLALRLGLFVVCT